MGGVCGGGALGGGGGELSGSCGGVLGGGGRGVVGVCGGGALGGGDIRHGFVLQVRSSGGLSPTKSHPSQNVSETVILSRSNSTYTDEKETQLTVRLNVPPPHGALHSSFAVTFHSYLELKEGVLSSAFRSNLISKDAAPDWI